MTNEPVDHRSPISSEPPTGQVPIKKKVGRSVKGILGGSFLTRGRMLHALPFLLYLFLLAMLYIANVYYSEKVVRETDDLRKELEELQYEFITSKSTLMNLQKSSELEKKLESTGIKPSTTPPGKIILDNKEKEN